jgi:catechol 2,3-dioxygenase-like lactoylglutathione lyase family enzyme
MWFLAISPAITTLMLRSDARPGGIVRPKTDGILESSLYVSDLPRSIRFYEETFGFCVISEFGERGCAMHAGTRQVLLLFKKGASRATQTPYDGDGELHAAFAIH